MKGDSHAWKEQARMEIASCVLIQFPPVSTFPDIRPQKFLTCLRGQLMEAECSMPRREPLSLIHPDAQATLPPSISEMSISKKHDLLHSFHRDQDHDVGGLLEPPASEAGEGNKFSNKSPPNQKERLDPCPR